MRRTLGFYDVHDEDCTIWDFPIDEYPKCICPGVRRVGGELPLRRIRVHNFDWSMSLVDALDMGYSRAELEAVTGTEFDSILTRCRRDPNLSEIHARLIRLSNREKSEALSYR